MVANRIHSVSCKCVRAICTVLAVGRFVIDPKVDRSSRRVWGRTWTPVVSRMWRKDLLLGEMVLPPLKETDERVEATL